MIRHTLTYPGHACEQHRAAPIAVRQRPIHASHSDRTDTVGDADPLDPGRGLLQNGGRVAVRDALLVLMFLWCGRGGGGGGDDVAPPVRMLHLGADKVDHRLLHRHSQFERGHRRQHRQRQHQPPPWPPPAATPCHPVISAVATAGSRLAAPQAHGRAGDYGGRGANWLWLRARSPAPPPAYPPTRLPAYLLIRGPALPPARKAHAKHG